MHPEDDSQTTLSKWPFILGDVLLVATALAIAILGHWQLTNWQVGACVAAVALGGVLFILPYVVEFQVRIREEREDRAGDLRILEKHILTAEQAIDSVDARIRALESAAAEAGQPNSLLAEAMDQKFAQLEAAHAAQEEAIQVLQKKLNELANKEPPPAFDPEILRPIEKRLKALETKPKAVVEAPTSQKKEEAPAPPKPEPGKAEPEAPKQEPAKTLAPIERPERESRKRHGPEEERLLNRAISENGDKSSTAVSRIIGSKAEEKDEALKSEEPKPKPEKKEEPNAEKPNPKKSVVKREEPEPQVEAVAGEAKPESKSKPEPKTSSENDKDSESELEAKTKVTPARPAKKEAPKAKPEAKPEPKAAEKEEPKPDPEAQGDSTDAESLEMLFDEEKITSPVSRTKAKKNDAVLTASVFIGIGNKPYLRGGGAGLSWDKGLPMEFQEIGKWRWVAPPDLETRIELQIFRNDEDPDKSGKCTLEPGQKLEVTPVF